MGVCSSGPQYPGPDLPYGGNYPFVGKTYSLSVKVKELFSGVEQADPGLLDWAELILQPNGSFRRPDEQGDVFPLSGISIKWKFDQKMGQLWFDFFQGDEQMTSRYDILKAKEKEDKEPDFTAWDAEGYDGSNSFQFTLKEVETKTSKGVW
eukprot:CAMPEP_0197662628 /NCGR_PEP_ID=MMETSP1338-20131121/54182_1 /TAXON_ID=43686 ORGANISM="Pelagodinium beii, Strain RCC1491" /NCGR_SAMPLE_ID=MMETSP1338 /ASSEMBLY_ACC=CAM_ASM_000754 /LENGTH=150 /DNA_ID=CAMNT_0043240559 /DNA_START=60 /DNA_END=509 /DNA_ORIENTATION=+